MFCYRNSQSYMWTFRHHSGNSHGAYCIFPVSDTDQTKFTEHLFFHKPSPAFWSIFCVCLFFLAFFVIPLVMNKFILLLVGNYMWQAVLQFYQLLWFLLIVNNKQNGDHMPVFMYVYWLYHYILYWQFLWLNLRWKI